MIYTETAKAMFRAYCQSANGVAFNGRAIPDWDALGDAVRRHWLAAAAAARAHAAKGGPP